MTLQLSLLFLTITLSCTVYQIGASRLVVSKEITNEYVFEGKEMTILYTIYNFHESRAAREVELNDRYSESDFIKIHGSQSARWSVIPASSNVTHAIVLVPRISGVYNFTSGAVNYKLGDESKHSVISDEILKGQKFHKKVAYACSCVGSANMTYTSAPGQVMMYKQKEFNKRFASHTMEWIGLALIVTPCLLIPYMLWHSSASKY